MTRKHNLALDDNVFARHYPIYNIFVVINHRMSCTATFTIRYLRKRIRWINNLI